MSTPTPAHWAWDVPLPPDAHATRVVLLALAAYSAPILPGTIHVRLGVVDPTHPAIAEAADMTPQQVNRHVAALLRADILVPAPTGPLVRFNEDITAATTRVRAVVADTLAVLPDHVPAATAATAAAATASTATGEDGADALPLDVPQPPAPAAPRSSRPAATDAPEDRAAKDILAWWWEHWTETTGAQVSNRAAFSAHAKRVAADMLAEGYAPDAIKAAFVAVDQPRPAEFAIRNHLRGKHRSHRGSASNAGATQPRAQATNPFDPTGTAR